MNNYGDVITRGRSAASGLASIPGRFKIGLESRLPAGIHCEVQRSNSTPYPMDVGVVSCSSISMVRYVIQRARAPGQKTQRWIGQEARGLLCSSKAKVRAHTDHIKGI